MAIRADNVAVGVIQRALDDAGISESELARRLGWFRSQPNVDKIRRALGKHQSGGGKPRQKSVTYDRAVELIDAMGLEPVDYGL